MPDRELSERVLGQLRTLGLTVHNRGGEDSITLSRGSSRTTLYATQLDVVRNGLGQYGSPGDRVLAIAEYISPRTAELLRHTGINYADAAGNASVVFGDVLIDVRGRPRPTELAHRRDPSHTARATNPFTTRRAQVTCALLAWPQLWHAPTRELASCSGVSLGLAHDARSHLRAQGFDEDATYGDHRLLDLWAAAFPSGMARSLRLGEVRGEIDRKPDGAGKDIYIGGESAIPHILRPATQTVYVAELTPQLMLANRWRTDGPGNVLIRRLFWQAPDDSPDTHLAPWPLIYADLFTSHDPRLRDAAEQWWRQSIV